MPVDWNKVFEVGGPAALTAVLGWLEGTFKWVRGLIGHARGAGVASEDHEPYRPPRKTLNLVKHALTTEDCFFAYPPNAPEPGMIFGAISLTVTNLTNLHVKIVSAKIKLPRYERATVWDSNLGEPDSNDFPPHEAKTIRVRFMATDVPKNLSLIGADVLITDSFENVHMLSNLEFGIDYRFKTGQSKEEN